jgi:hypothetical protein
LSILERPALGCHRILLDDASGQMMDVSRVVDLTRQVAGFVCRLLAGQDMEVVVGGMPARMPLCPDRCPEDDQIPVVSALFRLLAPHLPFSPWPHSRPVQQTHSVILAWMMYMLPIAPPALFMTHSSLFFQSVLNRASGWSLTSCVKRVSTMSEALADPERPEAAAACSEVWTEAFKEPGVRV